MNVNDALDELQQTLGLEPHWQQKLQDDADKRRRRQQAHTERKKKASAVRDASPTAKNRTRSFSSTTSDENEGKPRTQVIKERNPAKNPANKELADEFVDLGGHELKRGETQKGISRMKVAKEIRNLDEPVKSGAQVRKIRGVGRSAAAKVDEYLEDGKIHALEEFEEEAAGEDEEGGGDASEPEDDADVTGENQFAEDEVGDEGDEREYEDEPRIPADEDEDSGEQQV